MNEQEVLKVRQALNKIIKNIVNSETKSSFRLYKAEVITPPNGNTCEVKLIGDNVSINIPYSDLVENVQANDFVWVATIYKSFSNSIVFAPVDFNFELNARITNLLNDNIATILLDKIYPIGSIYISVQDVSPASFLGGVWTQLNDGYCLQSTTNSSEVNKYVEAGLPNITGQAKGIVAYQAGSANDGTYSGAISLVYEQPMTQQSGGSRAYVTQNFDASMSNSIYGSSNTVQPPAFKVYIWQRVLGE